MPEFFLILWSGELFRHLILLYTMFLVVFVSLISFIWCCHLLSKLAWETLVCLWPRFFQTLKTILHFSAHFGKVEIRESKYFNDNSEGKIETIHVINFGICKNWVQEKIGFLKIAYYLKGWIFSPKVWLFLCSNLVRKRWKLL